MASPSDQYGHPLPPPPQHQAQHPAQLHYQERSPLQQPQQQSSQHRQTKSRSFSFRSDKSHKSSGSKDVHETHNEKESRRLHSKADPSLAMNEAEPSAVAAMLSHSSAAPLRSMQHKDAFGNPIADPDKSNPTRNRWERPLDTIRSFEAAIDGGYNRKSLYRAETSDSVAQWNRRSSYHPAASQPRFPQDSYYGSRPVSIRQDNRNSFYDAQGGQNGGYYGQGQGPAPPRRISRMNTEPQYPVHGREQNVYPLPHKDRSYETVTSAAASGNSDPAGYHTDPTSSDNSSIERHSPAKRQEPVNDYGIGFSQPQPHQTPSFSVGLPEHAPTMGGNHPLPPPPVSSGHQQQYQQHALPPIPRKEPAVLRRQPTQTRPEMPEKRKSWFARRFSKGS